MPSFVAFVVGIGFSVELPALNRTTTKKALVAAKAWVSYYRNGNYLLLDGGVSIPVAIVDIKKDADKQCMIPKMDASSMEDIYQISPQKQYKAFVPLVDKKQRSSTSLFMTHGFYRV
ncbi:hypothetical protein CXF80_05085 [Shewanella sp. Actino-trap-3]|nr:hypothetical protein CXF80_05085 [Shewanella sp. Actino-trap-3]